MEFETRSHRKLLRKHRSDTSRLVIHSSLVCNQHGFTSLFYDRYRWYPLLGFDKIYFAQDLRAKGITAKCGSGFRGICDAAVADFMHQELTRGTPEKPLFVYWMTLNSHLPMDEKAPIQAPFDCSQDPVTNENRSVCLQTRAISRVLSKVAEIAIDPKLPPTKFIIVGDHSSPFITNDQRELFSNTVVPAIILIPKENDSQT